MQMSPKLPVRKLIGVASAITAGVALSRFTHGDWISGVVLASAVGGMCAWYLLTQQRPRDTRRY
jgi:cytochrome bd-type quinol oxidase subunit 1